MAGICINVTKRTFNYRHRKHKYVAREDIIELENAANTSLRRLYIVRICIKSINKNRVHYLCYDEGYEVKVFAERESFCL